MFRSFFLAGFECATGYNMHGEWIDQIAATEHDLHVDADYDRLVEVGIHAVREAIRWPLVDRHGRYDFSTVEPFVAAVRRHGFDVIWDLFHYGYPDELDPFADEFADRFAAYCRAAARFVASHAEGTCYFTPVNEPSYFAWAAGEVGRFAPHARGRGAELKFALARAAIRGIEAIWEECPAARIVNVDPICRVVPRANDAESAEHARRFNTRWVYEFWDVVAGLQRPEFGGSKRHLDIVGLNYYWTNQWELGAEGVPLADGDPRRVPLAALVRDAWRRYRTEVVVAETSALGEARAPWIHELSETAGELLRGGVPLGGICLYPILGMPEWHAREQWTRMGLWDLERDQDALRRVACAPMVEALHAVQERVPAIAGERWISLARTGREPFEALGRLVWQRSRDGSFALRLFRVDRPCRLWVLAVSLRVAGRAVDHVWTAAELRMIVDDRERWTLPRVAAVHGIDDVLEDHQRDRDWSAHQGALAQEAASLAAGERRRRVLRRALR
ncbi:MAG: hypothetical protein O9284_11070 [Steroidobacteraceae bacterium]|nr:hypothetical protein [Steroidobacteraceae bacterium]